MSFLRGLIGKKDGENKPPAPASEAAAKPGDSTETRVNPIAGKDAAAPLKARRKVPSAEQKAHFQQMQSRSKQMRVGKALIDGGFVNDEIVNSVMKSIQSEAGTTLQKSLVQQGFVREDDVLEALASAFGMDRIHLNEIQVTDDLISQIPAKVAKEYRVFPVAYDASEISIAIADPLNIEVMDDLQRIVGKRVKTYVCSEEEIDRFYKRWYEGDQVSKIYEQMTGEMTQSELDAQQAQEIDITEEDAEAPPVVKFVDLIFRQAIHERASDIHIEPTRMGVTIRFRIDGVCVEMPSPPKKWQNAILSRLKVLSGMDLAEKRIPQDGRIKLTLPDRKLDLRVSSLPSIYGESIVMRILDQSSVLLGLEDVGFLPDNITLFNSLIRTPTGVILMTGPTGSGKTTTLYSALSTLNSPEVKIVTIENPVEYMMEGVVQVQVNEEVGLDFKTGLRSILRQSPDVLLVGEMRDLETAEIGIRAALTGHLVFSTLHTNDAPSAPGRLVDMGVKPFLVASSLQAVVAQRLIRRLCAACKKPVVYTEEELIEVGASADEIANRESLGGMQPVGCDRCSGSGYRGRTAIHEIMVVDTRVRQMIIKGESGFRIKKVAVRNGMRTLRHDGWEKVKLGQTSISEVFRITQTD
jgi:type II secretory ATPase GspE/PulE/Tfp pilus assembly ATPase PilB-like protein